VTQTTPPATATKNRLNTVSLRLRVTVAVLAVLAVMLILLSIAINAIFIAQSNRNLDALLTGQAQLARQLARSGVGPQQIVNRVQAGGVQAHLVLRNGTEFGTPITSGTVKTTAITLNAPTRVDGANLTLAVDTALVFDARRTLRRILMITAVIALVVSAVLVAAAVRLALRPLDSMAALAKTVSQGNRGYRLAPTRTDTELGQTAQAFDEMLDELEGAETRAQQAEERTRAFLAAAETLLHHDEQLDHDERQHLQALLVREAERAGALISDLLTAARLDAGIDLDLAPVSLRTLAHSEIDRVRLLHPETAVTMSGPEVIARADAARVSSILRNVIDNAVRAAGPEGQVHLVVREHDQFAIAEIWDSGPGVPPSQRERIFERLVRLDHGRAGDAGGSGLGLAIARGYARAHGGDLTCEDPRGSGAMFRLVLPLEPRQMAVR